ILRERQEAAGLEVHEPLERDLLRREPHLDGELELEELALGCRHGCSLTARIRARRNLLATENDAPPFASRTMRPEKMGISRTRSSSGASSATSNRSTVPGCSSESSATITRPASSTARVSTGTPPRAFASGPTRLPPAGFALGGARSGALASTSALRSPSLALMRRIPI